MIFIKQEGFKFRKQLLCFLFDNKNVITYKDSNFKNIDISVGASGNKDAIFRSVTDIHKIVLSQFPKTKFESTVRLIAEIISERKNIALIWCNHINKVVVKYTSPMENEFLTSYSKKNYYNNKGEDGFSLKDYDELIKKLKN